MAVSATIVNQYYQGIFRTAPSSAVSTAYQQMSNEKAVLDSMLSSANVSVDPLIRLYQAAFNRLPDNDGMNYWVGKFSSGAMTLNQIANSFTVQPEFTTAYPTTMSNAQYVGALYNNVLNRVGDEAGVNYWVNQLNTGALTRAQVLYNFTESKEFVDRVAVPVDTFLTNIAQTPIANQGSAALYSGSLFNPDLAAIQYLTLTEAYALDLGGILPPKYSITDSTINLGKNIDIADLLIADARIDGIIFNAVNEAQIDQVEATYSVLDTLANILDADATDFGAAILAGASSYAISNATLPATSGSVAEVSAYFAVVNGFVSGASNGPSVVLVAPYSLQDTLANISSSGLLAGASSYSLTNTVGNLGQLTTAQAAIVLGAQNASDYTYNVNFSLTTSIDAPGIGAFADVSPSGSSTTYGTFNNGAATTLTPGDNIQATGTTNVLTLSDGAAAVSANLSLTPVTVSGIQTLNVVSGQDFSVDTTSALQGWTGLTAINSTSSSNAAVTTITAAATTDVTATDFAQAAKGVTVNGGNNVSVTENAGKNNAAVIVNGAAGTVGVTSVGTGAGTVTVDGGTDATVSSSQTGDVKIGATVAPTGTVSATITGGADLTITGGASQSVSASGVAGGDITLSGATGAILVSDSVQAGGNITIDGGTTVGVVTTVATDIGSGKVTVGGTAAPTGAVTVSQLLTNTAVANKAGGAITITGGSTVTVDQIASQAVAVAAGGNFTLTQSAVKVTGGATTTSVTVNQSAAVTAANTVVAVAGVAEVDTITFAAAGLANGAAVTLGGLTFTNNSGVALTQAQVAAAFANLSAGATIGGSALGIYTGQFSADYTTGAASATGVVATGVVSAAPAPTIIVSAGNTVAQTVAAVAEVAAAGTGGVAAGQVAIADKNFGAGVNTITTVSLDSFATGSTVKSDALSSLSLANAGAVALVVSNNTAASALDLTVDNLSTSLVSLDGVAGKYTSVAMHTTGADSVLSLTAAAVTALTIDGVNNVDLGGSVFTALKTVTVSGSAGVTAGTTFNSAAITDVNASATSGDMSLTLDLTKATYEGGSGTDVVTASAAFTAVAANKAVSLGEGNDTISLAAGTNFITGTIDGGAGSNSVQMDADDAVVISGDAGKSLSFTTRALNFGTLGLVDVGSAAQTVALDMIGFDGTSDVVVVSGVGGVKGLTLNGFASGATLEVAADNTGNTVTLANTTWAAGKADSANIVLSNKAGGTVVTTGVETLTVSNSVDAASALAITDANATSITISGAGTGAFTLTGTAVTTAATVINASAYSGGLVLNHSAGAAATITGGQGVNTLTASVAGDSLVAGNAGDTLEATVANVAITGGSGNDTITAVTGNTIATGAGQDSVTFAAVQVSANATTFATISDIGYADSIVFTGQTAFTAAEVTIMVGGYIDYVNEAAFVAGAGGIAWFQFEGNTYILADKGADSAVFVSGQDQIVRLTGLVELSDAVFNGAGGLLIG